MRRSTLLPLLLVLAFAGSPARAETVALAPPFTGSFTAEGCSMDGRSIPFAGTCEVVHEASLEGTLRAGVTMRGPGDGIVPVNGRGESLAKLSITDTIPANAVPSYDATFTVLEASGSRTGVSGATPEAGASGDRLVHALLRVIDPRPRCQGQIHGSLPGALVSNTGELAPGTTFTLHLDTPPTCVRSSSAGLTVEVSLFVRVGISDRGALPGGFAGYEVPGFGTVSALGSVEVEVTRTA